MKKPYPVSGQVYTLRQVFNDLELRDSPSLALSVILDGKIVRTVINDSHVGDCWVESAPGAAESQWKYLRETDEWIPCFVHCGTPEQAMQFVDTELENVDAYHLALLAEGFVSRDYPERGAWTVPKGFPRAQYYAADGTPAAV